MSCDEVPILHRAFALARTGAYSRVKDLEKALAAEGYARNDPQLRGPSVRKQLRELCRAPVPEVSGPTRSAREASEAEAS